MTWYPQDPVDRINRFLKEQHDPQYQLKREMYPLPMLRNAREAHPPVVKDEGQGGPAPPEDLYGKQARLEEAFARTQLKSGVDVVRSSQPDVWIPTPPPSKREILTQTEKDKQQLPIPEPEPVVYRPARGWPGQFVRVTSDKNGFIKIKPGFPRDE
jgi:hypothetical protein